MRRRSFIQKLFLNRALRVVISSGLIVSQGLWFSPKADGANNHAQSQGDVYKLNPGTQLEREIVGGQAHVYQIELSSGQYLHAVVEQKGVDVRALIFDPGGKKLVEIDTPIGADGPELVVVVADIPGTYRLEIRTFLKEAGSGKYALRIEQLRMATARDKQRVQAEYAFAEALNLFDSKNAKKAVERHNESLALFRELNDRDKEDLVLYNLGLAYSALGMKQEAIESLQQSLLLRRAAADLARQSRALETIGRIYDGMGENQKSLETFMEMLTVNEARNSLPGQIFALNYIGLVHFSVGEYEKALYSYNRALALARATKNSDREVLLLLNIGRAYEDSGDKSRARDAYNEALLLSKAKSNSWGEGRALSAIGRLYADSGERQKALEHFDRALLLIRKVSDVSEEAATLNTIGRTYDDLGDKEKALDYLKQALQIRQSQGNRAAQAQVVHNIGSLYASAGDRQKALEYFNLALQLRQAVQDKKGEGRTLNNIGKLYVELGESEKAVKHLEQAVRLAQEATDRLGEAAAQNNLGMLYADLGENEKALDYFGRALSLSRAVRDMAVESRVLAGIARAERGRNNLAQARSSIEEALNIIELHRSGISSFELRASYFATKRDYYWFAIDLLMQMHHQDPSHGHDASALQVSERARARSLLDLLIESNTDIRKGVDPVLLERERNLQQSLDAKAAYFARLVNANRAGEQLAATEKDVKELMAQHDSVKAQIRASSPQYSALMRPQHISLSEIQKQVLDPDTLLLEYALGEERSYLWLVSHNSINSYELPGRAEIERASRSVYDLLTKSKYELATGSGPARKLLADAESQYWEAARHLSQLILGPAASLLQRKRLLIVAEGALQYVPFAALPTPLPADLRTPLIARHEIVNIPSVSTLATMRRELDGRKPAPKTAIILADPVFETDDSRLSPTARRRASLLAREGEQQRPHNTTSPRPLPSGVEAALQKVRLIDTSGRMQRLIFTRQEARDILRLVPGAEFKLALDFDASRAMAISAELSQYRIIHFATHSLLNSEHPELSGIVLSLVDISGTPQNGFLRLHDIYNLDLPAELVILSACQTGLGKEVKGEGLVGLTRGFMYAGAARVIASLWQVDDKATAELMRHFHQALLGKDKATAAAALRAAQLSMWKDRRWQAPYNWAGFVLQGEWR